MQAERFLGLLRTYTEKAGAFISALHIAQVDVQPRRFKGEDLCRLVGVGRSSISAAIDAGKIGDLKETFDPKAGATIGQVIQMQAHFKTSPRRKSNDEPVTLAFTNFKGGCWKTTTCWYAASYYASLGYRVLCVDLDPQASLSENLGLSPDTQINEEQTLTNYICGLDAYPPENVHTLIQDTHVENLKIIPSCLALSAAEFELVMDLGNASAEGISDDILECFTRVRGLLNEVKQDFDIILLDGTPALGLLPMNIVFAADAVVVPVPTEPTDFSSTKSFVTLLESQCSKLNTAFPYLAFPDIAFLPTRYSATSSSTSSSESVLEVIRDTFGAQCLRSFIRKHEAVVSNLSLYRRTVFDVNAGTVSSSLGALTINSKARQSAMNNFGAAFDEILAVLVHPRWPSRSNLQ